MPPSKNWPGPKSVLAVLVREGPRARVGVVVRHGADVEDAVGDVAAGAGRDQVQVAAVRGRVADADGCDVVAAADPSHW